PRVNLVLGGRTITGCACSISDTKQTQCVQPPPPCPSPTIRAFTPVCDGRWGEGTLWRSPSQLTQCACGCARRDLRWVRRDRDPVLSALSSTDRARVADPARAIARAWL